MTAVSLIDVGRYLPGDPVPLEFYAERIDPEAPLNWDNPMFRPPKLRHVAGGDESATDMAERASHALFDRLGTLDRQVDILLTNVLLPDQPFTGIGATLAHRLGIRPDWIIDLHNTGCAAFVSLVQLAKTIIEGSGARTALLCTVQNGAGTLFTQSEMLRHPSSAIPGDGAAAAYVAASAQSPVLDIEVTHRPEAAPDCTTVSEGRRYWEPGESQLGVVFTQSSVDKIISRGNDLVPQVVSTLCARLDLPTAEIDRLITNQPNHMFLRTWSQALGVDPLRHLDTYDQFGNLFGSAAPITLSQAIDDNAVPTGALLVLAGFAHAGDFAGAAAVRWRDGE